MRATTLARYDSACRKASNDLADANADAARLRDDLQKLIRDRAPAFATDREIRMACNLASDAVDDLYGTTLKTLESAAEDGSYADREWEREEPPRIVLAGAEYEETV